MKIFILIIIFIVCEIVSHVAGAVYDATPAERFIIFVILWTTVNAVYYIETNKADRQEQDALLAEEDAK